MAGWDWGLVRGTGWLAVTWGGMRAGEGTWVAGGGGGAEAER